MDSQKGRVVEKNYICTVVSHHGNLPQNHGLGFFVLFLSFGPTSQYHFQVQETERVIISTTDFFLFFFFFSLQVLTGGLRTPKCCCYIFFPNQKAKCYHSNMTMLEMSICIAHIKVEVFLFPSQGGSFKGIAMLKRKL